ncbi:MAG TPA: hypothetical protein PL048_15095 [Leptospiraceae bacterium]|nr:hypothetical protein [Leptospiraceae bacterium]HMZ60100.1 hypothetical protein [Leptospiraceae bacterium]HNN04600.1 hypothetical protein [Leptospiraceae bacterium]HNO24267.1 hypothetical protein [Leptospiraceae bacterium]
MAPAPFIFSERAQNLATNPSYSFIFWEKSLAGFGVSLGASAVAVAVAVAVAGSGFFSSPQAMTKNKTGSKEIEIFFMRNPEFKIGKIF